MFTLLRFWGQLHIFKLKNQSKASLRNGARNTRRKSKVWRLAIRKEMQWTGIRKITRVNHSLRTSKTQQLKPCMKHHKLVHSHLITYTYTYICVQYLTGHKSLDHTMSKQGNKIHSIQGRELNQESSQTRKFTFSKRRSHLKSFFWSNLTYVLVLGLSLSIWSNPPYVSALDYLYSFDQIQPTSQH